jgi:hypothetical protein
VSFPAWLYYMHVALHCGQDKLILSMILWR